MRDIMRISTDLDKLQDRSRTLTNLEKRLSKLKMQRGVLTHKANGITFENDLDPQTFQTLSDEIDKINIDINEIEDSVRHINSTALQTEINERRDAMQSAQDRLKDREALAINIIYGGGINLTIPLKEEIFAGLVYRIVDKMLEREIGSPLYSVVEDGVIATHLLKRIEDQNRLYSESEGRIKLAHEANGSDKLETYQILHPIVRTCWIDISSPDGTFGTTFGEDAKTFRDIAIGAAAEALGDDLPDAMKDFIGDKPKGYLVFAKDKYHEFLENGCCDGLSDAQSKLLTNMLPARPEAANDSKAFGPRV
jgi:uncharacterized protein YoxC